MCVFTDANRFDEFLLWFKFLVSEQRPMSIDNVKFIEFKLGPIEGVVVVTYKIKIGIFELYQRSFATAGVVFVCFQTTANI